MRASSAVRGGERLGPRGDLGPLRRARTLRAPARGVGADARAQLQRRALGLELGRHLAGRREREEQVQPAVVAPVAHAGRSPVADADEPGLLEPLERLPHGVAAGAELLGEAPLRGDGGAGRERAGEDVGPQLGVDAIGQEHWLDQLEELVVPEARGILKA